MSLGYVIVDVDGTVCDSSHRLPHEEDKIKDDKLIEPVANLVNALRAAGYDILFLTAREERWRKETKAFLTSNFYWFAGGSLIMKPVTSSPQTDWDFKLGEIERLGQKVIAIDDNERVIETLRDFGHFVIDSKEVIRWAI